MSIANLRIKVSFEGNSLADLTILSVICWRVSVEFVSMFNSRQMFRRFVLLKTGCAFNTLVIVEDIFGVGLGNYFFFQKNRAREHATVLSECRVSSVIKITMAS